MVWPSIRQRVTVGFPLSPRLTANKFNRDLKATMTSLKIDQGGLYSPHAFRRGATQDIKDSGSTLGTILGTGAWLPGNFKHYINLMADDAINVSTVLLDTLGSDSEDSDPDIETKKVERNKRVTERMREIPLTFRNGHEGGADSPGLTSP